MPGLNASRLQSKLLITPFVSETIILYTAGMVEPKICDQYSGLIV